VTFLLFHLLLLAHSDKSPVNPMILHSLLPLH